MPATPQTSHRRGASTAPCKKLDPETFIDDATLVYATAGLGVVHNLQDNAQHFFDANEDDVTCIGISKDSSLAATGTLGKAPVIKVWQTNITNSKDCVAVIGRGFFDRGVCSLAFSFDNKYIVGVSCDDYHSMGVFSISTGELAAKAPCSHGLPPQIRWMVYCNTQQYTEYINRAHHGLCDVFATAGKKMDSCLCWFLSVYDLGEQHIRLWSFRRQTENEEASLVHKAATIGKVSFATTCFHTRFNDSIIGES